MRCSCVKPKGAIFSTLIEEFRPVPHSLLKPPATPSNLPSQDDAPKLRVVETVVLENGRFVPCRKQVVLTKIGENSEIASRPQKQGILLLGPRKSTKMTKMAGVTPAK